MKEHNKPEKSPWSILRTGGLLLLSLLVSKDRASAPAKKPSTDTPPPTSQTYEPHGITQDTTMYLQSLPDSIRGLPADKIAEVFDPGFAEGGGAVNLDLAHIVTVLGQLGSARSLGTEPTPAVPLVSTPVESAPNTSHSTIEIIQSISSDMERVIDSLKLNITEYEKKASNEHSFLNVTDVQAPLARAVLKKLEIIEPVLLNSLDSIPELTQRYQPYLEGLQSKTYYNPKDPQSLITLALAHSYLEIHRSGRGKEFDKLGGKLGFLSSLMKKDATIFELLSQSDEIFSSSSNTTTKQQAALLREIEGFIKTDQQQDNPDLLLESYQFIRSYQFAHGFMSMMERYKTNIIISDKEASQPVGKFTKGVIAINPNRILPSIKSFFDTYFNYAK